MSYQYKSGSGDSFSKALQIELETCLEGRNAWKELRLACGKFKFVVTGGLYGCYTDLGGLLGVSVPPLLYGNSNLLKKTT